MGAKSSWGEEQMGRGGWSRWGEEQMGEEQLGRVERGPQSNWGKRESTSRRIEDERWTNVGQVLDNIQTQYTLLRHEDT